MKILACLLSLSFALPLAAAPTAANDIFATFKTKAAAGENIDALLASLRDQPDEELKSLGAEIEKTWPRMRDGYLAQLDLTAKALGNRKKGEVRDEIRKHRAAFMEVYAKDGDEMKPLLHSVSMPAVEALRKILVPTAEQVVESGGEKLKTQRKLVIALARFRDAAHNSALFVAERFDSVAPIETAEKAAAAGIGGFERADLKVLAQNRSVAKDRKIPEPEARGIEECNQLRMLVGLRALMLDPKLCEAARDHSKDMAEKGFFAHDSPVPGKKTPWDRAKNFGTSASGENIFMGNSDPHEANMGWFYSPGHHKNMFAPGHLRIGLGCHGNHWTEMFGD